MIGAILIAAVGAGALGWLLADLHRAKVRRQRWQQIERAQERAAAAALRPRGNVDNVGPH